MTEPKQPEIIGQSSLPIGSTILAKFVPNLPSEDIGHNVVCFSQSGKVAECTLDPPNLKVVRQSDAHTGLISCIAMDMRRRRLFIGQPQGRINYMDLSSAKPDGTFREMVPLAQPQLGAAACTALVADPNGTRLYAGYSDGVIRVWSTAPENFGKLLRETQEAHLDRITALAIATDGVLLASGSTDQRIKLWRTADLESGSIDEFFGHKDVISSLSFAGTGELLACAFATSRMANVVVWWVWPADDPLLMIDSNRWRSLAHHPQPVTDHQAAGVSRSGDWEQGGDVPDASGFSRRSTAAVGHRGDRRSR
jgi:WD40 repeat protein